MTSIKTLLAILVLTACIPLTPSPQDDVQTPVTTGTATDTSVVVTPTPPAPPIVESELDYPKTGWIKRYDDMIKSKVTDTMINQPASRMNKFCPGWESLSKEQRVVFYTDLLYSITSPESKYKNLSMYVEDLQGLDSLTGLPTISEGFLQLSYQDKRGYPTCEFDWKKDYDALKDDIAGRTKGGFLSKHPERDPLNPFKNLRCGVAIVNKLLTRYPDVEFADLLGKYWSTMRRLKDGKPRASYGEIWTKMRERKTPCG